MSERRLDAYYYGFNATGVDAIDKVLSAVAWAGKAYHHTDSWCDDCKPYEDHTGETPVDWIWNAAKEAAARIEELERSRQHWQDCYTRKTQQELEVRARIEALEAALRNARARYVELDDKEAAEAMAKIISEALGDDCN